ncbi:MAG TPA: hypothetical protein VNS33_15145 [Bradyrhizobium sp.]|nr:hypothetical protein [Bradyrhizobium sp.]
MRRTQRLIAAFVLIAFSGALGGCSSGGFDPTDLLDFLDTKKKLPGERKPVFPDGVPGLEQGVPKDLYKGAQQQNDPNAQAAAAPPPQEPPPSKQATKSKKGKSNASVAAAPAAAAPDAEAAPEEDTTPAAPPAPKPSKLARKRTTAPPPDQSAAPAGQSAQQGAPFPAPMPSGTFTR